MTVHFPHLVLAAKELAAATARGPLQCTVHSSYPWLHLLLVLLPFTPLSQLLHFVFLYMSLEAVTTPISGYMRGINKQERIWTNPLRWMKSSRKACIDTTPMMIYNSQQAYKKMTNFTNYTENENQNHNDILPHAD